MVEAEAPEKIAKQRAVDIARRAGAGHGEDQNVIAVDIKYGLLLPDAFPVAQVAGMDNFTQGKIIAKRSGAALPCFQPLMCFSIRSSWRSIYAASASPGLRASREMLNAGASAAGGANTLTVRS